MIGVPIQVIECLERSEIRHGSAREHTQVHFHSLRQGRHDSLNPPPVVRRKVEKEPETLIQPFEQDSFSRILLKRPHGLLNSTDLSPVDLLTDEIAL